MSKNGASFAQAAKTLVDDEETRATQEMEEREEGEDEDDSDDEVAEGESASGSEDSGQSDGSRQGNGKFPFPRATITKLVRRNISKGKQIKGSVKDEMNLWVASIVERVANKLNSQPYTFVNYDMLKEAIAPYEDIQGINSQREGMVKKIISIKEECDAVINQIDAENKHKVSSLRLEQQELPFPKATITNKLRKHLSEGKTIKGPVKKGLNVWMGSMVERVSKKMDSYTYPYVDRSMFKEAIEPYETVGEIELEKERIIQQMESMKTICDLLVMEIERKFKL